MASEKPPWREGFDQFERAVGRPLEAFVQSDAFADAMAAYLTSQAEARRQFERGSQELVRAWNLASAAEVEELRERVARLEEDVATLRRADDER